MKESSDRKGVQGKLAGRRRSCLGCLGRVALGLVIFLVIIVAAGAIYQAAASASDAKMYPPPGELFDVGEYRLHLYCTGEGSPTVILEAGAGMPALTWYLVQKEVGGFARVCSYDRPGFGWSDPAPSPLSPDRVASDLYKLLETAHVPGPYILVGHSAGGFYVRAFTRQYASMVVGLVLVDAAHEQLDLRYPPEYVALMKNSSSMLPFCQIVTPLGWMRALRTYDGLAPANILPAEIGEAARSTLYRADYCKAVANENEAVSLFRSRPDLPRSLGDLPLTVLSAGMTVDEEYAQLGFMQSVLSRELLAKVHDANQEMQLDLASLSTAGIQIIAEGSGHNIQYDRPDLVFEAIRTLVDQARK